jgi:integrase
VNISGRDLAFGRTKERIPSLWAAGLIGLGERFCDEGIEHYQRQRLEAVSARTVNIEVGAVKTMLNWAVEARLVQSNPLARIKPLRRDKKKFRRALRPEEAQKLLAAARKHTPRYADVFLCALHTGLRKGELQALTWDDVDFDRGEVAVRGEVAKNHRARRIPMSAELRARLEILREKPLPVGPVALLVDRLKHRERRRGRPVDLDALRGEAEQLRAEGEQRVFRTECGTPIGNSLLKRLATAVEHAGIDKRGVDLHALRYTFGSWLVKNGVNIKLVSRLMGHATVQLTLDIYTDTSIMDWEGAIGKLPALEVGSTQRCDGGVTAPAQVVQRKTG